MELHDVAPMEDAYLEKILARVPPNLKSLRTTMKMLVDEIKEDYLFSVQKAFGTYYLLSVIIHKVIIFQRCKYITYMYALTFKIHPP